VLHDKAPAHKAASVCQFFTPKMLQPFITPRTLQIYLRQTFFLFPKLKMKLIGLHFADVAEIEEAVTDALKKVQKEEFSVAFQKLYDSAKTFIYANGAYTE
jgi:hypothetical protein